MTIRKTTFPFFIGRKNRIILVSSFCNMLYEKIHRNIFEWITIGILKEIIC